MKLNTYLSRFLNMLNLWGNFSHLYRVRQAKKVHKTIVAIAQDKNNYGRAMVYLRKINPYVFEELMLTALECGNVRVVRNKSYSADGGIDGYCYIGGKKILIQCKRYSSYINNQHVQDFSQVLKQKRVEQGLFIHTGRTGERSKYFVKTDNSVIMVSGSILIDLLVGRITAAEHIKQQLNSREIKRLADKNFNNLERKKSPAKKAVNKSFA